MEKLNRVQKVFKVFKVLSLVVAIATLAGGAVTLIFGIVMSSVGVTAENILIAKVGEVNLYLPWLSVNEGLSVSSAQLGGKMISEGALFLFEGLIYMFTFRYLSLEQKEGTPFTEKGAAEMKKLGILSIVLSVVGIAVSAAIAEIFGVREQISGSDGSLIITGIVMIIGSLVLSLGASLNQNKPDVIGEEK